MPSNALKISQLIAQLSALKEQHGDIDCVLALPKAAEAVAIDGRNVGVAVSFPWGRLPAPVVAIGIWIDHIGNQTNMPGQRYAVTPEGEQPFNYDRSAAPDDKTPLIVWKRYIGEDRGFRDGGKWWVYEGEAVPTEIVPEGILGWRLA
jgi:hypothetical protein